jgi:DNA-directed RNA polymerase I subunit RPA43
LTAVGTHSLSSPSHISLLLYKTFNVSIPISHIPTERYEFDHSIATKPARSGTPSTVDSADSDSELEDEEEGGEHAQEVGRWVDKSTGKVLGEDDEGVMFTVVR